MHDLMRDADLRLIEDFVAKADADRLMHDLQRSIPWSVHRIRIFGRWVDSPRLSCWIGDASYRYSGVSFDPEPWNPGLLQLKERVEAATDARFNSVLANLYRDGADSMGWHSDDEPELGRDPLIASLSLGAPRRFLMRRRDRSQRFAISLPSGSLLLMQGASQRDWQHALPKTRRPVTARINLTFRQVASRD